MGGAAVKNVILFGGSNIALEHGFKAGVIEGIAEINAKNAAKSALNKENLSQNDAISAAQNNQIATGGGI